jgi:hypothetical protein
MIIKVKGREPFELAEQFYVNPDDWFRNTWLIESNWSNACTHQFIVEADTIGEAIDELLDSKYGHLFKVSPETLNEYMEEFQNKFKEFDAELFYNWMEETKDVSTGGNDGSFYHSEMFMNGCINSCKVEGFNYEGDEE